MIILHTFFKTPIVLAISLNRYAELWIPANNIPSIMDGYWIMYNHFFIIANSIKI